MDRLRKRGHTFLPNTSYTMPESRIALEGARGAPTNTSAMPSLSSSLAKTAKPARSPGGSACELPYVPYSVTFALLRLIVPLRVELPKIM